MTDVPELCDRLRAFHSKIMNEAADALEREVENWKRRNRAACAAEAERDDLVTALGKLLLTAKLLQQNSIGCAELHHGLDTHLNGLPGWLEDSNKDIAATQDLLNSLGQNRSES